VTNYRLRMNGLLNGTHTWSCGYHITSTAALATVATTLDGAWNTLWTDGAHGIGLFLHTDVTLVNTTVYQCNASWLTTAKTVTDRALAGTDANPTFDYGSAPFIELYDGVDNRSDRGFIKFPPPATDAVAGSLLTSTFQTALNDVLGPFFTTMKGLAGYTVVSYNRLTNKAGDPPFTNHTLTNYSLGNKLGTNRKRKRKLLATNVLTGSL
jgi:hypothetical protein